MADRYIAIGGVESRFAQKLLIHPGKGMESNVALRVAAA